MNFLVYLKDFKHTLKHLKEELTLVELGSHLCIEESLRAQDNDKPKGNNIAGPLVVNMVEHNNSSKYNDNKGKRKHHDTKADPNKKPKDDDVAWWVNSIATIHVCKDRCWFKTYESLNDGSILHIGNESTTLVHGRGSGYHQKDRKPSQNDKTEHGMEKTVQNQGQSPKMPKSESILKNTIECNLNPSDGPGKPNIKHAQPEEVQELLSKLVQDVKIKMTSYLIITILRRESPSVYCDEDYDYEYTMQSHPYYQPRAPVEILVPIPSDPKVFPKVCDVSPFHDNSPLLTFPKDQSEDFSDSNVNLLRLIRSPSSSNDVEYVEASPPNSTSSSRIMEIVIPEVGRSGYHQKDRKPSQNDKTEHGMEKNFAKIKAKSKNVKVRVNTEESESTERN
ncbi:hypothetical protein Tco_0529140 [Tanacetum coccineum]